MTKGTKYTATYEGKVAGKRTSPRPYLFAIIVRDDIEIARQAAYGFQASDQDRKDFDFHTRMASGTYTGTWANGTTFSHEVKGEELARHLAHVEGGFEAYVARKHARLVEQFEARVAAGAFEPRAVSWSMSRANAEKTARTYSYPQVKFLAIVPAVAEGAEPFRVLDRGHGRNEPRGSFPTFEGAHREAVSLLGVEGGYFEVLRGDQLIWDSHNGRSNV